MKFFTYTNESIIYYSVYLILACVKNFVMTLKFNNEIKTINTIAGNHKFHYTMVNDIISILLLGEQRHNGCEQFA